MMYVIKKGKRYVANADKEVSFTRNLEKAYVSRTKINAKDLSYPDKGEIIVKVTIGKQGKLVEVK